MGRKRWIYLTGRRRIDEEEATTSIGSEARSSGSEFYAGIVEL